MLHKLLKYNLRKIFRTVVIFYAITLSCALLGRLFRLGDSANPLIFFFREFFTGAATGLCFGAVTNNVTRIWEYTNRDFYGDQSYLTHTLPIPRHTLYLTKLLATFITLFATAIVVIGTILIAYGSTDFLNFLYDSIATAYGPITIILTLVVAFLEIVFIALAGVTGIILGHRSDSHKSAKSFTYGFAIFIICNLLTVGLAEVWGIFDPAISAFINQGIYADNILTKLLVGSTIIYLIYIATNIVISNRSLQKGIDVE